MTASLLFAATILFLACRPCSSSVHGIRAVSYPLKERKNSQRRTNLDCPMVALSEEEFDRDFRYTFSDDSLPKTLDLFYLDLYEIDVGGFGLSLSTASQRIVNEALQEFLAAELDLIYAPNNGIDHVNAGVLSQSVVMAETSVLPHKVQQQSPSDFHSRRHLKERRNMQEIMHGNQLLMSVDITFDYEPSPNDQEVENSVVSIMQNLDYFVTNLTALASAANNTELANVHTAIRTEYSANQDDGGNVTTPVMPYPRISVNRSAFGIWISMLVVGSGLVAILALFILQHKKLVQDDRDGRSNKSEDRVSNTYSGCNDSRSSTYNNNLPDIVEEGNGLGVNPVAPIYAYKNGVPVTGDSFHSPNSYTSSPSRQNEEQSPSIFSFFSNYATIFSLSAPPANRHSQKQGDDEEDVFAMICDDEKGSSNRKNEQSTKSSAMDIPVLTAKIDTEQQQKFEETSANELYDRLRTVPSDEKEVTKAPEKQQGQSKTLAVEINTEQQQKAEETAANELYDKLRVVENDKKEDIGLLQMVSLSSSSDSCSTSSDSPVASHPNTKGSFSTTPSSLKKLKMKVRGSHRGSKNNDSPFNELSDTHSEPSPKNTLLVTSTQKSPKKAKNKTDSLRPPLSPKKYYNDTKHHNVILGLTKEEGSDRDTGYQTDPSSEVMTGQNEPSMENPRTDPRHRRTRKQSKRSLDLAQTKLSLQLDNQLESACSPRDDNSESNTDFDNLLAMDPTREKPITGTSDTPYLDLVRRRRHAKALAGDGTANYQNKTDHLGNTVNEKRSHAKSTAGDGTTNYQNETSHLVDTELLAFDGVSPSKTTSKRSTLDRVKEIHHSLRKNKKKMILRNQTPSPKSPRSTSANRIKEILTTKAIVKRLASTKAGTAESAQGSHTNDSPDNKSHLQDIRAIDSLSFASGDDEISNSDASVSDRLESPPKTKVSDGKSIQCRDCYAPPGRLGIVIRSTKDGPAIHAVKQGSSLSGNIFPGDLIIRVGDVDTRSFSAEKVMELVTSEKSKQRKLTVLHFAEIS